MYTATMKPSSSPSQKNDKKSRYYASSMMLGILMLCHFIVAEEETIQQKIQLTEDMYHRCQSLLTISDGNRDQMMNSEEYVAFLNHISNFEFEGSSYGTLPVSFQANFNASAHGGVIDISGDLPSQNATGAQTLFLQKLCYDTINMVVSSYGPISNTTEDGHEIYDNVPSSDNNATQAVEYLDPLISDSVYGQVAAAANYSAPRQGGQELPPPILPEQASEVAVIEATESEFPPPPTLPQQASETATAATQASTQASTADDDSRKSNIFNTTWEDVSTTTRSDDGDNTTTATIITTTSITDTYNTTSMVTMNDTHPLEVVLLDLCTTPEYEAYVSLLPGGKEDCACIESEIVCELEELCIRPDSLEFYRRPDQSHQQQQEQEEDHHECLSSIDIQIGIFTDETRTTNEGSEELVFSTACFKLDGNGQVSSLSNTQEEGQRNLPGDSNSSNSEEICAQVTTTLGTEYIRTCSASYEGNLCSSCSICNDGYGFQFGILFDCSEYGDDINATKNHNCLEIFPRIPAGHVLNLEVELLHENVTTAEELLATHLEAAAAAEVQGNANEIKINVGLIVGTVAGGMITNAEEDYLDLAFSIFITNIETNLNLHWQRVQETAARQLQQQQQQQRQLRGRQEPKYQQQPSRHRLLSSGIVLNASTIVVSSVVDCTELDRVAYPSFCKMVTAEYVLQIEQEEEETSPNEDNSYDNDAIIERYYEFTIDGIQNGKLQEILGVVHPESAIFIIGLSSDSNTNRDTTSVTDDAAAAATTVDDDNNATSGNATASLNIKCSFNVDGGYDMSSREVLDEAFREYVSQLMIDLTSEETRKILFRQRRNLLDAAGAISLDEESVEIYALIPCAGNDDESCATALGSYDVLIVDEDVVDMDPTEIQEAITDATQSGIDDGALTEVINEIDPESEMVILLPPPSQEEEEEIPDSANPADETDSGTDEPSTETTDLDDGTISPTTNIPFGENTISAPELNETTTEPVPEETSAPTASPSTESPTVDPTEALPVVETETPTPAPSVSADFEETDSGAIEEEVNNRAFVEVSFIISGLAEAPTEEVVDQLDDPFILFVQNFLEEIQNEYYIMMRNITLTLDQESVQLNFLRKCTPISDTFPFCIVIEATYEVAFTGDDVDDIPAMEERYTYFTQAAIEDGSFAQIVTAFNPSNQLLILPPPTTLSTEAPTISPIDGDEDIVFHAPPPGGDPGGADSKNFFQKFFEHEFFDDKFIVSLIAGVVAFGFVLGLCACFHCHKRRKQKDYEDVDSTSDDLEKEEKEEKVPSEADTKIMQASQETFGTDGSFSDASLSDNLNESYRSDGKSVYSSDSEDNSLKGLPTEFKKKDSNSYASGSDGDRVSSESEISDNNQKANRSANSMKYREEFSAKPESPRSRRDTRKSAAKRPSKYDDEYSDSDGSYSSVDSAEQKKAQRSKRRTRKTSGKSPNKSYREEFSYGDEKDFDKDSFYSSEGSYSSVSAKNKKSSRSRGGGTRKAATKGPNKSYREEFSLENSDDFDDVSYSSDNSYSSVSDKKEKSRRSRGGSTRKAVTKAPNKSYREEFSLENSDDFDDVSYSSGTNVSDSSEEDRKQVSSRSKRSGLVNKQASRREPTPGSGTKQVSKRAARPGMEKKQVSFRADYRETEKANVAAQNDKVPNPHRATVEQIINDYFPEKKGEVDSMLAQFKGKEKSLIHALRMKSISMEKVSDSAGNQSFNKSNSNVGNENLNKSYSSVGNENLNKSYSSVGNQNLNKSYSSAGNESFRSTGNSAAKEKKPDEDAIARELESLLEEDEDPIVAAQRKKVQQLVDEFFPEKKGQVDMMMAQFKGRESALVHALKLKAKTVAKEREAKQKIAREKVEQLVKDYFPERMGKIDSMMTQFKGRESDLIKGLEIKAKALGKMK